MLHLKAMPIKSLKIISFIRTTQNTNNSLNEKKIYLKNLKSHNHVEMRVVHLAGRGV